MPTPTSIVTGAASGIGRAIAERLLARGDNLLLIDTSRSGLDALAEDVERRGGRAVTQAADITDEAALNAAFARAAEELGPAGCAFNCAGVELEPEVKEVWDLEAARRTVEVNLMGTMLCMRLELAQMAPAGAGAIVNVASIASIAALAGKPGYVSSKHAILGLTRTAALQYGPAGVRVNAVCPGATRTGMTQSLFDIPGVEAAVVASTPLRRIASPEEIAAAAVWLASDEARFVTGQGLVVDGGMTLSAQH